MIMVQKPVHLLSSPSTYHRRRPSAPPVVHVQPTHIPGLLSLSKPHPVTPPRSQQQHQNNNRQPRSSNNRSKPTSNARASQPTTAVSQPLLSEDLNKLSTPGRATTKPHPVPVTSSVTPEKPPRGRQNLKFGKDKSKPRSNSQSGAGKNNNRRNQAQHHQGSPPNLPNLPSQAEATNKRNSLPLPLSLHPRQHNSFDPFLVSSESESDNPPPSPVKAIPPVRPAPKLTSRPTGKLARRRQNSGDTPSTPTPSKALSVPRRPGQPPAWENRSLNISRSVPSLSSIQSGEARDVFPICDDLTDAEDDDMFAPSTPVRSKGASITWQQPIFDDGPHTAPLSNPRSGFLFGAKPVSTQTPERKREHVRSPSEGVFNLSMDEDSSFFSPSDASELKAQTDSSPRRRIASAASTPMGLKRDFWASSKFQNSPSPDVLPIPAFKGQVALH